jgi:nitroreductase
MDFQQVVQKRRMARAFREEPLARKVVERILANGNRAPSAGFTQGYGFLVLEAAAERARFWQTVTTADHQPAAEEMAAPLLVVPLACKTAYLDRYAEPDKGWTDKDEARWPIPYWYIDTGFAALLMLLTAVDEGLGGLFSGFLRRRPPPFGRSSAFPMTTSRSA